MNHPKAVLQADETDLSRGNRNSLSRGSMVGSQPLPSRRCFLGGKRVLVLGFAWCNTKAGGNILGSSILFFPVPRARGRKERSESEQTTPTGSLFSPCEWTLTNTAARTRDECGLQKKKKRSSFATFQRGRGAHK